jgi:hypothetical protein
MVIDNTVCEGEAKRDSNTASPQEGWRLVQAFLRVERADLREEILNFVEGMVRRQDGR